MILSVVTINQVVVVVVVVMLAPILPHGIWAIITIFWATIVKGGFIQRDRRRRRNKSNCRVININVGSTFRGRRRRSRRRSSGGGSLVNRTDKEALVRGFSIPIANAAAAAAAVVTPINHLVIVIKRL